MRASDLRATKGLATGVIERELVTGTLPSDSLGDLWAEPLLIANTADRSWAAV